MFLLFVQHGWADDNQAMLDLARQLEVPPSQTIAPSLGYIQTWIRIAPLIDRVEAIAARTLTQHPDLNWRIIGHSMGGLIWLEILHRNPHWWARVHSFVLLGSPVGGADMGRILDPLKIGLGVATDLGRNRKPLAEAIATTIPTLSIAGDVDDGSDGIVPITASRFAHAQFVCLPDLFHPALRNSPLVAHIIQQFWKGNLVGEIISANPVIQKLQNIPGMTDGHIRDFSNAKIVMTLKDGNTIRVWRNPLGVDHVFVSDPDGRCLYAGFVGWLHSEELKLTLHDIYATEAIV